MKLKQIPADFIVEEIPSLEFTQDKHGHAVYLMEKQEIDTFEALRLLAKKTHVPLFEIGYAGLKDKHALTKQYISLPAHYSTPQVSIDNVKLIFVGYHHKKIKIGDLQGNRFWITARDVKQTELKQIEERAQVIPCFGVPNYFDSQRFGSVINNEFIIKHIIEKKYEQAVKIFLTSYLKSERKNIKDEKRKILSQWNNLNNISVRTRELAQVITEYRNTGSWLTAYKRIPAHLREMYVNAYQSFLWNECVKETLKTCITKEKLYPVEYAAGSLLFYTMLTDKEQERIPEFFPTLSSTVILSEFDQQIVDRVITKQRITLADFDIEEATKNFFKTRKRPIRLQPKDFIISEPQQDEINNKNNDHRFKITVSFSLPQGSYATLITKRLFGN
ncbi:MAG: tRNA pseudouridine(13) synthase TruD [Euryarchaeota archaeon]|nr:tRNA pseudouridine(13) synthase TruD [Euryarchaeota archaeon]